ncbi:MAG: hypothetical protein JRJ44_03040 [Deltaproteobacteria bacterium]|nr:hypothetical protein [Deltaproteobacteria bacterium]
MPREIKQDLLELRSFLNDYSLSDLLKNDSFNSFISKQHKKYFSYLTFIAELQNIVADSSFDNILLKSQFYFIKESCSDVGIAFFLTFHGSYKSSKLLLRSSIETFLKGFCLDDLPDIDKETSISGLFKKIKKLIFFNKKPSKEIIETIHQNYKSLCEDAHTATDLNMANISALNYFPRFEEAEAQKVSNFSLKLIPNYLALLSLKYNKQFHRFHYENRSIIINSISKKYRQIINNIK